MTLIIAAGGDSKHNESEDCAVSFGVVLVGDERGLARSRSRLAWLRLLKGDLISRIVCPAGVPSDVLC